jgi:hypothetical protein
VNEYHGGVVRARSQRRNGVRALRPQIVHADDVESLDRLDLVLRIRMPARSASATTLSATLGSRHPRP